MTTSWLPSWFLFGAALLMVMLAGAAGPIAALFQPSAYAEYQAALAAGPPERIDVADFDPAGPRAPRGEVALRGQVDPSMSFYVTNSQNPLVQTEARMLPLYGVEASSTGEPPLVILLYPGAEFPDAFVDSFLSAEQGAIGPIVEIDGLAISKGSLGPMIRDAFEVQIRAYDPVAPAIRPFFGDRETALLPDDRLAGQISVGLMIVAGLLAIAALLRTLILRDQLNAMRAPSEAGRTAVVNPSAMTGHRRLENANIIGDRPVLDPKLSAAELLRKRMEDEK
ncbi:MAG: hypothetical protein AAGI70_11720 [Pseudomonadota bacterium]